MANQRKHLRYDSDEAMEEYPKRLRGGGGDDFGDADDDLYNDDDFYDMMDQEGPPPPDDMHSGQAGEEVIAFGDIKDAHKSRWSRPAVPSSVWDTNENDLNLQWLDIDMIGGSPLESNPNPSKKVIGSNVGPVPIIRLYGVNETGNSVAVFIHGFTPYGYFALPRGYELVDESEENRNKIRDILDENLRAKLGSQFSGKGNNSNGHQPRACHLVQYLKDRQSVMGYDPSHTTFLKVFVGMPGMIPKLKSIMEEGIALTGIANGNGAKIQESMIFQPFDGHHGPSPSFQPFECNVPFVMRYMIDQDITGATWLTLPKGTYRLRKSDSEKGTHCQVRPRRKSTLFIFISPYTFSLFHSFV